MIPSPALPLTSPVTLPGAVLPGAGGEGPEGADFAALLAQSAVPVTLSDTAQADLSVIDPALAAAMPIPAEPAIATAEPAAAPATPGKILPVQLPLTALPTASDLDTPKADQPGVALPHDPPAVAHVLPLSAQAGKNRAAALRARAGDKAPAKDVEPETPQLAALIDPALALAGAPTPVQPDAVQQLAVVQPTAALPAPNPGGPAETAASADPVLARTLPLQVAAAVVRTLSGRAQPQPVAAPQAAAQQAPAAQATAALVPPAAPPLTQVRLDLPLPEMVRPARVQLVRAAPVLAATLGDETETAASAVTAPALAPAAPTSFSPAAPAPLDRPHDFSALIDRLAAAREAAAPHSVSISLPHAEFGRVQLHFRSDDGALAVSLASADPDFARIAAQAAPPVLAVGDARSAEHTPGQQSARSEGQSASASQQGNQRGPNDERRSDRSARFDHQPRTASSAKGRGRSGIFA